MSGKKRRSYEAGHRPKFLVVIDASEECGRALHFAARRAGRVSAGLVLLAVIDTSEFQHFLGVGDVMKREAREKADALLERYAAIGRTLAGIIPDTVVASGIKAEEILAAIERDEDIAFLVLAAATGAEGPGPLVASLAGKTSAQFPIPVVIVPGGMTDDEIDALA